MTDAQPNFDNIRIVLVEPKVPGNVGAASRAMKNMGLTKLVLVNPWFPDHPQAKYMAHGSEDVLEKAEICQTLDEAVGSSVLVIGTTQRQRHGVPFLNPPEAAQEILENSISGPVSILFGREDRGLLNEELAWCQMVMSIPSSEAHPSLNLSQAVMVMAYQLFSTVHQGAGVIKDYAPSSDLDTMYGHLRESLELLGLKQWNEGDNYMKSLRRVFSKTRMERRDVSSIHKLCGEIDKYVFRVRDKYEKESDGDE